MDHSTATTPVTRSPSTPDPTALPIPAIPAESTRTPRRTSFNFLKRTKSGEQLGSRGSRSSKKLHKAPSPTVSIAPPILPDIARTPQLRTFSNQHNKRDSVVSKRDRGGYFDGIGYAETRMATESPVPHKIPIPPIPDDASPKINGHSSDPYPAAESMAHRGRYSYASSAISTINSPRRLRRRKDPTPFNILVIGARNSGKTSFLNFLRSSLALPVKKGSVPSGETKPDPNAIAYADHINPAFTSHYLETEIEGERVGLTIWDSPGLEKNVVDLQLREINSFIESKFEETFAEELKLVRSPGVQDTHIHCVFLLLDPIRLDSNIAAANKPIVEEPYSNDHKANGQRPSGPLDEGLDLQVIRGLQGKTTVIPVISKADTLTTAHMTYLKRTVFETLKAANLDPFEALGIDGDSSKLDENDEDVVEDEDDSGSNTDSTEKITDTNPTSEESSDVRPNSSRAPRPLSSGGTTTSSEELPWFPLSIISPDTYEPDFVGRKFPWGSADPYNVEHCDFMRLKESVFAEWRGELREASRDIWYEGWRTSRLERGDGKRFGSANAHKKQLRTMPYRSMIS